MIRRVWPAIGCDIRIASHICVAADLDGRRIQLLYAHWVERFQVLHPIQRHDRNAGGIPGNSDP